MKKTGVLLLVLLSLSIFSNIIVLAQDTSPLPIGIEELQDVGERGQETLGGLTEKEKRAYLFEEWTTILLDNKFISIIDSFFTKISFIFRILLGEPYTLSGILFVMILLWLFLFLKFGQIMKDYSPFSALAAWVIGLGMAVMIGQVGLLRKIAELLVSFIFYKESTLYRSIIALIIIAAFAVGYAIASKLGKRHKEQKEKTEVELNKAELKAGADVARKMIKGAGGS